MRLRLGRLVQTSGATLGMAVLAAACGGDSGGDDVGTGVTLTAPTTTASSEDAGCPEPGSIVVFDVFGTLTTGDNDADVWVSDPASPPAAREGMVDLVKIYHDQGHEVLYVTTEPAGATVGDESLVEALNTWLADAGFPLEGDQARLWSPDPERDLEPLRALTQDLIDRAVGGRAFWAGYSSDEARVEALLGGVPRQRMYTLAEAEAAFGTVAVASDELEAHRDAVAGVYGGCGGAAGPEGE